MNEKYGRCADIMKEVKALSQALGVIGWDQETMMPPKGITARSEQSAALAGVVHEKHVSPRLGELLKELSTNPKDLSEDEKVCVREWLRDYEKATKLPQDLVVELERTSSLSQHAWIEARKKSDFKAFAPWLEKTVELKRRQADAYGYELSPYDALLDDFEPEMTSAELNPIVEELKKDLVPFVRALCGAKHAVGNSVLKKKYESAGQEKLIRKVVELLGLDPNASRIDRSAHPFCTGLSIGDVRITTRYDENWLPDSLYGIIHETGHALYEQNLDAKREFTPLAEAVSAGVHESQSRLWENVIGRGMPFVKFLFPHVKKIFPKQLSGVKAQDFWRALNKVEPSLIRVEADEVTYNLHVMLRYEIEKGLIEKDISVKDAPAVWNEKMRDYLGIVPKKASDGILQDTHWAQGYFGYFPTYMLGNLYAAQWWSGIRKDVKSVDAKIAAGNFKPVLKWLKDNIHSQGRRHLPSALVKTVTGEPLKASHFVNYLKSKYSEVYNTRL